MSHHAEMLHGDSYLQSCKVLRTLECCK